MLSKYKKIHLEILYIFLIILSLIIFFFSTSKVQAKAYTINNIEISEPFEINFDKNKVIDIGFKKAFSELISLITSSIDKKKIGQVRLNEIKGMIESFTIKEEQFIDEIYYVNLGVSFNKKQIFNYLEKRNIFPSIPVKNKFLFIPIIIEENKKDLLIFSDNEIYNEWNNLNKSSYLIEYILPTDDLEDINFIRNNFENIEQYNFIEIIDKYDLDDSIIALIFKNDEEIRILSRITIKNNIVLKNQTFSNINLSNDQQREKIINDLKTIYEDYWKMFNQINTSIKLYLNIKVENLDNFKIMSFEKNLMNIDLINDFFITKFDKDHTYYQIVFNGTLETFLKTMNFYNYDFDTQNKIWVLR